MKRSPLPFALLSGAVLLFSHPSHAQGQGTGVGDAAAVAGVVVEVIGGLSSWINDQTDDCAAAGLGAAWGKDCNLKQDECTETGYASAYCKAEGDNACGHGFGQALAQESLLGSWASCTTKPFAIAWTKPLHSSCDKHNAKGWGKASVDGTSRASTDATPDSKPQLGPLPQPAWPRGTVLVVARLDTVRITKFSGSTGLNSIKALLRVNGTPVWAVTASMNAAGQITTTGPIPPTAFRKSYDATTGTWQAILTGYQFAHPVDTLDFPLQSAGVALLADGGNTSTDVSVSMESEASAEAEVGNDDVCAVSAVTTCGEVYTTTRDGSYVYVGQEVSVANVVTVLSSSLNSQYLDMRVSDGTATLALLDPFQGPGNWREGDRVQLGGQVTLHEGDLVMTDVSLSPAGRDADRPPPEEIGFELDQNGPNPFNPVTTIRFSLRRETSVKLEIFAVTGRRVKTLVDGITAAGSHELVWDGTDDAARHLGSGLYFYSLEAGGKRVTRKMILSR